jgi:hypothetical protein
MFFAFGLEPKSARAWRALRPLKMAARLAAATLDGYSQRHSRLWSLVSQRKIRMQLAPMRFVKIDGTAVSVTVTSAEEAKAALKELRHKKRELKFLRGALGKKQRAGRAQRAKAAKAPKTGLQTFLDDVRWGLSAIVEQGTEPAQAPKPRTLADIEAEVRKLDETLHNIEGCILQLQGKLLSRS